MQADILQSIIEYGIKAPSGHNTQPWKFRTDNLTIRVIPDYRRRLPVVDPDDHALFISLGCAVENIVIAARHFGFESKVVYFPEDDDEESIKIELQLSNKMPEDDTLFLAIEKRQSTRNQYDGYPIPAEDLNELKKASRELGIQFCLFDQEKAIEPLIALIKEANLLQFTNPDFVEELISWIRFSKQEALRKKDGLRSPAVGSPSVPTWLGRFFMRTFASGAGEAQKCEKLVRSSSALMLFITEKNDKEHWVRLGRSFERVALTATSLGICHAHVNMPCEEISVRTNLKKHLGLNHEEPLLLLRIGYADTMPYAYRRPLEEVLIAYEEMVDQ